jgi:hypothetical protein
MSVAIHLTSLACALGTVIFATIAGHSTRSLVLAGVAFAATLVWPMAATVPAATGATGLVAAAVAVAHLTAWSRGSLVPLAAGWLAASWAILLQAHQGLPLWAGAMVALAIPCVAVWQARRHASFAPARLCEDALVLMALVAVCAAAAPGLVEGWRAAVNLKFGGATQAAAAVPTWALAVSLAGVGAGAGYGAWSRR